MPLRRLLSELKRRQVYRPVVVYATLAWVLLEGADIVFPRLGFADESVTLVLILALIGFPIAIYLAWVYDITPDGIFRTQPLTPGEHRHFSAARIVEFLLIGALVAVVGYLYVDRLALQKQILEPHSPVSSEIEAPDPAQYRAIAVLPFDDMSEAGDQAWFAEGIAEELLHALASIEELHVMARTSSFAFKDTGKTIEEIADILNVQAVLEGSVRRSGDRVRVTAQLVDADTGYHIWSGSYQRQLRDIFELQDELARSMVNALRAELGVDRTAPLIAAQTNSPEAYNWFLRGRALDWANPQATIQSIGYLEKAVEADPDYALAWAYLAMANSQLVAFRSFDEVMPPTVAAYESALALNPQQSEALVPKALVTQIIHHDYEAAGKLYQQANYSGHNQVGIPWYSLFFLVPVDQIPLAIRLSTEAEQVDPLNAGRKANLAFALNFGGDAEAAIVKAREALALNPEHEIALAILINAYGEADRFAEGQRLLEQLPPAILERPRTKVQIGLFYAASGDRQRALEIYRNLAADPPRHGMIYLAKLALKIGEVEEAIDLMEREVEINSFIQFWARPLFRNEPAVQNHPRYLALLKRIGLNDESVAELHNRMSFD